MSRDYRLYLRDILEACEKVRRYTRGVTADQFVSDEMRYGGVV